jgi:hypothetical protein
LEREILLIANDFFQAESADVTHLVEVSGWKQEIVGQKLRRTIWAIFFISIMFSEDIREAWLAGDGIKRCCR